MRRKSNIVLSVILIVLALLVIGMVIFNQQSKTSDSDADSYSSSEDITDPEITTDPALATDTDNPENTPAVGDDDYTSPDSQGANQATLYVSKSSGSYKTTSVRVESLTASNLIKALASETNWNLDASVTQSENKITVAFASTSSLYTGIPSSQSKDYYVATQNDLDRMILDSIKATIQGNLGEDVEVYYTSAKGSNLVLSDVDVTIQSGSAYTQYSDYEDFFPG